MTKEEYADMTEFIKEEPESAIEYLEVNYDDISNSDLEFFNKLFGVKEFPKVTDENKEEAHRALLEIMYEACEEKPKKFLSAINNFKMYLR